MSILSSKLYNHKLLVEDSETEATFLANDSIEKLIVSVSSFNLLSKITTVLNS